MSNESALITSIADQLTDIIDNVKAEIEPIRVMMPKAYWDDGKYYQISGAPRPSENFMRKWDEAKAAPEVFKIGLGEDGEETYTTRPVGYLYWDRAFWQIAILRGRAQSYVSEMRSVES